jgi:hypothetical protein
VGNVCRFESAIRTIQTSVSKEVLSVEDVSGCHVAATLAEHFEDAQIGLELAMGSHRDIVPDFGPVIVGACT